MYTIYDPTSFIFINQKMGWTEGTGLGATGEGQVAPIAATVKNDTLGIGAGGANANPADPYELYRLRMQNAYRHRPNPFNNPRNPYY